MTSKAIYYCVYRITNLVEKKHYYGYKSSKVHPSKVVGISYFSSSRDKEFIEDQKLNQQNYRYKVVQMFSSKEEALVREIKLHAKFDVGINLNFYNKVKQISIGFDYTDIKHSAETRAKLSALHKGKIHSEETKTKMSKSHKGQMRNLETRAKISVKNKGRKYSAEQNKKNSERQSGRIVSEATKAKLSELWVGRTQSPDQNLRISESKRIFYYISPISIVDNSADLEPTISAGALLNWCKNPNKKINKKTYSSSKYLYTNYRIDEIIGKTFGELGFDRIKKELFCLLIRS